MPQSSQSVFSSKCISRSKDCGGFSLVEVILSIGVVSFAFLAMFGLMPAGLTIFRQAIDNSLGSQIVQRIVGEAQQTDYPTLIASGVTQRYFDDQGNEVASDKDYLYAAEISVLAPTELPNASVPPSDSLATVTIKLANNPGHLSSPFASASRIAFTVYTALIAKNQ
jgi:uncharacterized protein (TIGR02598 family)